MFCLWDWLQDKAERYIIFEKNEILFLSISLPEMACILLSKNLPEAMES